MSSAFEKANQSVDFLFSGREPDKYFSMQPFGAYQTRKGLSFSTEKGKISYVKTAISNNVFEFFKEVRELDLSAYDLVINDFEPITAWAAKIQKVPCISISHQNAFRYTVPLKGASWLDKKVVRYFAPANYYIGLHWYHFDQPILPPIVHSVDQQVSQEGFVLVYLPFESLAEVIELLFRFVNQPFVCFHPDAKEVENIDNIQLHPLNHEKFQHCLSRCNGVITNGGFELPSEALNVGKKLLLKPLNGQFEQMSNVATLESLGLASAMDFLDPSIVRDWLEQEQSEKLSYPNVSEALVEWVLSEKWDDQQSLSSSLWRQVDIPTYNLP